MGPDALAQVLRRLPKFEDPDLLVGFDTADDAAVYRIDGETAVVQTVDLFPPVVDDPFLYGAIAAANALSDVYAMGASPRLAMNICCFPEEFPQDTMSEILMGGYEKVREAGAVIAGGHTIKDPEPKYGLCVTGFAHPSAILTNGGAKEGDVLILTKPLGTGILNLAAKADLIEPASRAAASETMAQLNRAAWEIMKDYSVHSCTDITGFGLLGHCLEMARASNASLTLVGSDLPLLPQALEMARMGIIPKGAYANRTHLANHVRLSKALPLEPVSYTHLDVYKRQGLSCETG